MPHQLAASFELNDVAVKVIELQHSAQRVDAVWPELVRFACFESASGTVQKGSERMRAKSLVTQTMNQESYCFDS
eukprot:1243422-Amphidinium_carterae.1